MKTRTRILSKTLATAFCATLFLVSCSSDDNSTTDPKPNPEEQKGIDFQVAFVSDGAGSSSSTYLHGFKDISTGDVSFGDKGFSVPSARTARVYTSADGKRVYNLNYTVGTLDLFEYKGGQNYNSLKTIDASILLGTKSMRFTKMNEQQASVHNIASTPVYDEKDKDKYLKHEIIASVGIVDLTTFSLAEKSVNAKLVVSMPEDLAKQGYHISRIDSPVLSGNKLYYGTSVRKFDEKTGKNVDVDLAMTLVVDYPALDKATVITTNKVKGASNGYRTATQHVNEKGEILQMVSDGENLSIVKIVNGKYDESFVFNVSEKLSRKAASNGWFYSGNGIAYIPYERVGDATVESGTDPQGKPTYSASWGLAKLNFNTGNIVNLEVPEGMDLGNYQVSTTRDNKFYIALAPKGGKGNVYIFDTTSDSSKGQLGATLTAGAKQYYIGIF